MLAGHCLSSAEKNGRRLKTTKKCTSTPQTATKHPPNSPKQPPTTTKKTQKINPETDKRSPTRDVDVRECELLLARGAADARLPRAALGQLLLVASY